MRICKVLVAISFCSVALCRLVPSPILRSSSDATNINPMRLRGGFTKTLAAAGALKEVPKLHHFSDKLSGGASSLPALDSYPAEDGNTETTQDGGQTMAEGSGAIVQVDNIPKTEGGYDWKGIHRVEPWRRASVNADFFDKHTKGRNMILSVAVAAPFAPFLSFSFPSGQFLTRARLSHDKGSWLNRFIRSPISPLPGLFSTRRSDPIEAMQRRPFLVIPLEPSGPMSQPHPLSRPVDKGACRGGTVQCLRTIEIANGDALSYFELRASGRSELSCLGVVKADSHEPDSRDYDFLSSPTEECAMFFGNGGLRWTLGTDGALPPDQVSSQSAIPDPSRAFRGGDRVGMVVDLAAGKLGVVVNGRLALVRSHLPKGCPLRFVAGLVEPGAAWTIVDPARARGSLKGVDWEVFYAQDAHVG
eukprot:CAMPEP_0196736250 /NCGR_PEP_ID=MMETSP1091-20130531/14375_1 /TAXON_ID=302021 /ORGANISM="Rhodomonas sp., Strain CCMP768" /LENGTH=417 /DNA_ID=CAMNT_0042079959 /DNA_START=118 /DNA_END=1371 /DNA_ORIENTATION=+